MTALDRIAEKVPEVAYLAAYMRHFGEDGQSPCPDRCSTCESLDICVDNTDGSTERLRIALTALAERLEEAERRAKSLEYCGNCKRCHLVATLTCDEDGSYVAASSPCHHDPSEWEKR
jgi:hypothetical protein